MAISKLHLEPENGASVSGSLPLTGQPGALSDLSRTTVLSLAVVDQPASSKTQMATRANGPPTSTFLSPFQWDSTLYFPQVIQGSYESVGTVLQDPAIATSPYIKVIESIVPHLIKLEKKWGGKKRANALVIKDHFGLKQPFSTERYRDLMAESSPETITKLLSSILQFRLLDVCLSLSEPQIPSSQSSRVHSPLPPIQVIDSMASWPSMLSSGLAAVLSSPLEDDIQGKALSEAFKIHKLKIHQLKGVEAGLPEEGSSPAKAIFTSLTNRVQKIKGQNIQANFEAMALHLNLSMESAELPSTVHAFQLHLSKLFAEGFSPAAPGFFQSLRSMHTFRLPLHLSLAVSPLSIFIDAKLFVKDVPRSLVSLTWQALGGPRPGIIVAVERLIWCAALDVATGNALPALRFRRMCHELSAIELSSVTQAEAEWFKPDPFYFGQSQGVSRLPGAVSDPFRFVGSPLLNQATPTVPVEEPESVAEAVANALQSLTPKAPELPTKAAANDATAAASREQDTGETGSNDGPQSSTPKAPRLLTKAGAGANDDGTAAGSSQDTDKTGKEAEAGEAGDSKNVAGDGLRRSGRNTAAPVSYADAPDVRLPKKPNKRPPQSPTKPDEDSSPVPETSPPLDSPSHDFSNKSTAALPLQLSFTKKRASSESSSQIFKRQRLRRVAQVIEVIDLTVEFGESLPPDASLSQAASTKRHGALEFQAFGLPTDRPETLCAIFSNELDAQYFNTLLSSVRDDYVNNRPPHIRGADTSVFQLCSRQELDGYSVGSVQAKFRGHHLVVTGPKPDNATFDAKAINNVSALSNTVQIRDFTRPSEAGQDMPGSARQILEASRAVDGKVLAILHQPMPDGVALPKSLTSDLVACATRWGSVLRAHAFVGFTRDSDGRATYLKVEVGKVWVALVHTDIAKPASQTSFIGPSNAPRLLKEPLHTEGMLLAPVRPDTDYLVYAMEDSILHGGTFYSSGTMMQTNRAVLRSLIQGLWVSSHAWLMLRRLTHYFHRAYVETDSFISRHDDPDSGHLPDPGSVEGLLNILALANMMEMGNVLVGDTYQGEQVSEWERHDLVEARRNCRRIVQWIELNYVFKLGGEQVSLVRDIWGLFLARQVKAISFFVPRSPIAPAISTTILECLDACFGTESAIHPQLSDMANWVPDTLDFPSNWTVCIEKSDDEVLLDLLDEIDGYTPADANHFSMEIDDSLSAPSPKA
ncbi:hypothetical protein BKA70DRAFT_1435370 [Coprinopsis sp. MPI-PUGE-AT-0042]|nr:hypothetical protein BKA70DRAFT_1435370 [Coprinopsis sp. MPI-PUGE-AT-0042]